MIKETKENIVHIKSTHKELVYTKEFKESLAFDKNIFQKFIEIEEKMNNDDLDKELGDKNLKIVLTAKFGFRKYFKVTVNNKDYFVKEVPEADFESGGGPKEALNLTEIKKILEETHYSDWAEVSSFEFSYQDEGKRYFVARWDERLKKTLLYWLSPGKLNGKEHLRVGFLRGKLREVLRSKGFRDLSDFNLSYDPVTKKIIIFDILKI